MCNYLYSLLTVFKQQVPDLELLTQPERNPLINGYNHNHPGSLELDLEEIENIDNESTERGMKATYRIYRFVFGFTFEV